MEIKNSGKSTGFISALNISGKFVPAREQLPERPEYTKSNEISPGPIVAGGSYKIRNEPQGFKDEPHLVLTDADVSALKRGDFIFYIYGAISYTDEFSIFGERRTGFCARYNPEGDAATSFDNCPDKNYTYAR